MYRAIFLILVVLFLSVPTSSGQLPSIKLRWSMSGLDEQFHDLNQEFYRSFHEALTIRGVPKGETGTTLFGRVITHPTSNGELLIMSISEGHSLRDSTIEAGARHQIWYAGQPVPEDATEAKFVREYMTREVLSNQVQITNIVIRVFERSEIDLVINSYIDNLVERLTCFSRNECGNSE